LEAFKSPKEYMSRYCKSILVVEDDEADQLLIKEAFQELGMGVRAVNNGEEAIRYLMGEGKYSDRTNFGFPTFIITDLKMPIADGFAVLEHIFGNPEWAMIPRVVLSASDDPDDIKKSYMLGASSYHKKPNSYKDLRDQLRLLHQYWMTCEAPEVDVTGRQLATNSIGKLGERFPQTSGTQQTRIGASQ
jgi:CheY-like chemotaxis protein